MIELKIRLIYEHKEFWGVDLNLSKEDDYLYIRLGREVYSLLDKESLTLNIPLDVEFSKGENRMTGVVKKVLKDKGFGWIKSGNVEYFFHQSALKNIRFEDLEEGREVTFEDGQGPKGPRAEYIYV